MGLNGKDRKYKELGIKTEKLRFVDTKRIEGVKGSNLVISPQERIERSKSDSTDNVTSPVVSLTN
ncbi:hypothetical protein BU993_12080 [Flavobacterium columnare]|nr:hypothetical protein BU993_12080 [Flavobacterium columnare]